MSTDVASLHDVGYRRAILALGALWGAAPALVFGLHSFAPVSPTQGLVAIGTLMTLSLGLLYELDSRALAGRGTGVPLAWSYALVVPISVVVWGLLGPALAQIPVLGLLVGPPARGAVVRLAAWTERERSLMASRRCAVGSPLRSCLGDAARFES